MFETSRLYIKPISSEEDEFIFELMNSPLWIQNIGNRNIHTIEDARAYIIEKMLQQYVDHGYGNNVVYLKEGNIPIGTVGIYNRPGLEIQDIGFAFLPEFLGKGYGYESSKVVLDDGFTNHGLKAISAITLPENVASIKLIEKLGLRFIKNVSLPDDPVTLAYYLITKEEWLTENQDS